MLKPSEHTPLCAEAFVEALVEAGIPAALLNLVHGAGEPGAALAVHRGVGALSFTGSVPTGRKVAASAMETGPRVVSLELGGKNAMVVLEDADLDLAVEGALFGAFGTAGQRCTSTSRLVLHHAVADLTVERIAKRAQALVLGDPLVATTDVGPVVDRRSAERILAMIEAAVEEGATVVTGGQLVEVDGCDGGAFVAPTVLTGVRPEHAIARNEVFGPVLSVIEVGSEDEAIDVVNASEYGLSAAVYTRDINVALQMVDRIDTGIVYVNAPDDRGRDPAPVRRHEAHGERLSGGRHAGHRAVQPGEDGVRRLLGPPAEGPDRHPPRVARIRSAGVAELVLQHLAGTTAGERVDDAHLFRCFEVSKALANEADELVR